MKMTDMEVLSLWALRISGIRHACNVCGGSLPIDSEPVHKCKEEQDEEKRKRKEKSKDAN